MDPITTPGPIHDVAESLFLQLDKKTLMDCRLVSKEWKKFLDRPTFWFKKLSFKNEDVEEGWKSLAKVVNEEDDIDDEVKDHFVLPLMKMYSGKELSPLGIVWKLNEFKVTYEDETTKEKPVPDYEDPILSKFILEHITQDQEMDSETGHNSMFYATMFYAAMFGYPEVIKKRITNCKDINAEDGSGGTVLHHAAENGHLDIVKFLIYNSAKPITRDHDGWTAMHWAASNGQLDIVKFLNDYPDARNIPNNNGRTPLHTAVEHGQLEVLHYLMQYSSHPNAPGNDGETTTMGIAASKGRVEIVKFLANHIADSPNEPDEDGWTPLHDAAFQ